MRYECKTVAVLYNRIQTDLWLSHSVVCDTHTTCHGANYGDLGDKTVAAQRGKETRKGHKGRAIYTAHRSCDLSLRYLGRWELVPSPSVKGKLVP